MHSTYDGLFDLPRWKLIIAGVVLFPFVLLFLGLNLIDKMRGVK